MDLNLVWDDLEAIVRTLRLAHAQLLNLKKQWAHAPEGDKKKEELESIELIVGLLLTKIDHLMTK